MKRLPVGSMIWLYEPPYAPVEGMITGYEDGALRLQVHRKLVPTPLVSSTQVYARLHDWPRLVETLREDALQLEQFAAALEKDCQYRKME